MDPHCCQECRDELRALVVEQTQVIGAIEDKIAFYEANQTQAWHRVAAQDLRQAMRDAERAAVTKAIDGTETGNHSHSQSGGQDP